MAGGLDEGVYLDEGVHMATTVEITRTYYQSPLGLLRVGGTDTYISEIHFVDRLDEEDHRNRELGGPVTPVVIQCIEQLIQYFRGSGRFSTFRSTRRVASFSSGFGTS